MALFDNRFRAGSFQDQPEYDRNRYEYGGYKGGAREERLALGQRQWKAEGRRAPQIATGPQSETRAFQMGSLGALEATARGAGPSRAEILGQQMADRALQAQVSAAGNVRGGPGAQAAAYRSAAQQAALQQAQMAQGIQAERAAEMAAAQQALAQAATAARGQDIGLATDQARLLQQQTALNDARAMQYENLRQQVTQQQLQADLEQQRIQAAQRMAADALNQRTQEQNRQRDFQLFTGAMGAITGGLAGGALLSDPAAKVPVLGGSLATLGTPTDQIREHSSMATRFVGSPGAMPSDERTKQTFGTVPKEAMARAMRTMEPSPYAYREEMRPPEQAPGEVNIGPMANRMASDPVARTAVVRDPESGMLGIDRDKADKLVLGSLASLQAQIDELRRREGRRGASA